MPSLDHAEVTSEVIHDFNNNKMNRTKRTAMENPQTMDIIDHFNHIRMSSIKS